MIPRERGTHGPPLPAGAAVLAVAAKSMWLWSPGMRLPTLRRACSVDDRFQRLGKKELM